MSDDKNPPNSGHKPPEPNIMYGNVVPGAWARHARHLRASADSLWIPLNRALTTEPPYSAADLDLWHHTFAFLLVAGASLEAMIKATALFAKFLSSGFKEIVTADGMVANWMKTHDLAKLCEHAKIELSQDDSDELARFTRYIVWAGSYPTPLDLRAPTPDAVIRFDYRFSNLDWCCSTGFFGRPRSGMRRSKRKGCGASRRTKRIRHERSESPTRRARSGVSRYRNSLRVRASVLSTHGGQV